MTEGRARKRPRFVRKAVPLVMTAFGLGFLGVLAVDLFIEHQQIEGSTRAAVSTISTLREASAFEAALERYLEAAAYGTPDQPSALNALLSARSGLVMAMEESEQHDGADDRPVWQSTRERIAALEGAMGPGSTEPTDVASRARALEGDASAAVNLVTRSGLERLSNAERLHTLHGALEAGVLLLMAGVSVASLLVLSRREADARARDAQVEEQLRHALADLDHFAGRLAHDLRNPLVPILGHSRLIEKAPVPDAVRVHAQRIERSAQRAKVMIDSLLEYTQASAGGEVEGARTHLNATVKEVLEDCADAASSRHAFIVTNLGPDVVLACPSAVLRSILTNLVDNAVKYGGKDDSPPRVILRTRVEGSAGVIEVEDAGPGIPNDLRERVFEPLFRGQVGGAGIGLGLAIVRRHIEKQHGRIELDTGEEGGALFRVALPIAPATSSSQQE
jgi:signal transduction histidine kinase